MKINVKKLNGLVFPLEAESSDTILSIKTKIQAKDGTRPENQRMVFVKDGHPREVKNDQALSDCNIPEGSTLHMGEWNE